MESTAWNKNFFKGFKLIAGDIGAGKSFKIKTHITKTAEKDLNRDIIVIDPLGDYNNLIKDMGGKVLKLTPSTTMETLVENEIRNHSEETHLLGIDATNHKSNSTDLSIQMAGVIWLLNDLAKEGRKVAGVIENSHHLLGSKESAGCLTRTIKNSKALDMGVILVEDNLNKFCEDKQHKKVFNTISRKEIFRLRNLTQETAKELGISENEREFIKSAKPGTKGCSEYLEIDKQERTKRRCSLSTGTSYNSLNEEGADDYVG